MDGVPLVIIHILIYLIGIFPYKPSSYWATPMAMETPMTIPRIMIQLTLLLSWYSESSGKTPALSSSGKLGITVPKMYLGKSCQGTLCQDKLDTTGFSQDKLDTN